MTTFESRDGELYIDGKSKGVSPVMRELEKWESLFSEELRAGKHEVEVVHGYVSEDGQWDGEYPKQPRVFRVSVAPGSTTTIQYSFAIGWFGEDFFYEPPWRGGGK